MRDFLMKRTLIFISLMTQKASKQSRAKDNHRCLSYRLEQWKNQDITTLLKEAREIQRRLRKSSKVQDERNEKAFCRLMLQGKVKKKPLNLLITTQT